MANQAEERDDFFALLDRTNKAKPSKADIEQLKQYLADVPAVAVIVGNAARQVEIQLVQRYFGHSKAAELSTEAYLEQLRNRYGYQAASPLERSLIHHVVVCWLRLHICELRYDPSVTDATLAQARYWEDKLTSHQKRYLRSVETLTRYAN